MPAHGVAPLIMELVHKNASEVSLTLKPFLETPLTLTPSYRDWRSLNTDSNISIPHIYFDNLQIERPSPLW